MFSGTNVYDLAMTVAICVTAHQIARRLMPPPRPARSSWRSAVAAREFVRQIMQSPPPVAPRDRAATDPYFRTDLAGPCPPSGQAPPPEIADDWNPAWGDNPRRYDGPRPDEGV